MANLVAVSIKRKDAELPSHGFSMFLDPKRIKLQEDVEIPEMMMEEEEALSEADGGAAPVVVEVQPTMLMLPSPSPLQPTQGQESAAVLHDSTVSTEPGSRSSEPASAAEPAAPMAMDIEEDSWQSQPPPQPRQHPHFFSGFF